MDMKYGSEMAMMCSTYVVDMNNERLQTLDCDAQSMDITIY
jgi:hypothetical protein